MNLKEVKRIIINVINAKKKIIVVNRFLKYL